MTQTIDQRIIKCLEKNVRCDTVDLMMWLPDNSHTIVNAIQRLVEDGRITRTGDVMGLKV